MILYLKNKIKSIMNAIVGMSIPNHSIAIYKTLIINFKLFGFNGIKILPILVYHNTKIFSIGKISFGIPLKHGLLTIGKLDLKSQGITKFNNKGEIIIKGYVEIGGCCIIDNVGTIELGGFNRISDGTQLFIRQRLMIGENTDIGFHSFIMDSDDHFTIDVETKIVGNNNKPISIGKGCWIGNTTFIKKGTILPDYTIVASANALLAKDYTNIPPYSVLGGMPAKVIKTGIRRIRLTEFERQLKLYFKEHPGENTFHCINNISVEELCKQVGADF